jgi:hypothetical protein
LLKLYKPFIFSMSVHVAFTAAKQSIRPAPAQVAGKPIYIQLLLIYSLNLAWSPDSCLQRYELQPSFRITGRNASLSRLRSATGFRSFVFSSHNWPRFLCLAHVHPGDPSFRRTTSARAACNSSDCGNNSRPRDKIASV